MTEPVSNPADGMLKVVYVSTIANPAAPTVAELNAGTAVDLSCYLTADGYTPGTEEASITDDRLCSRQTYERPGRFSDTLEIGYVFRAQDPAGTDNKAFHTLQHLVEGYIVERWGVDYEDPFAAGDVVDVKPIAAGAQRKQKPEANSVLKIMQKLFIKGAVERDAVVTA